MTSLHPPELRPSRVAPSPVTMRAGGDLPTRKFVVRQRWLALIAALIALAVGGRLVYINVLAAPTLSAQAAQQREDIVTLYAKRGAILDRQGRPLAYTGEARALTFLPRAVRAQIEAEHEKNPALPDVDSRLREIAAGVSSALGGSISADDLMAKLTSDDVFEYLARSVSPETANKITADFPEVGADPQAIRIYPGGSLAANVVGDVNFDGNGHIGLESSLDPILAGMNGTETFDRGSDGAVIPGSKRNVHPAIDGRTVKLTLDSDIQWFVQAQVNAAKVNSGAENASAVVLDAKTGEVLAMANDNTFNAARPLSEQSGADLGNRAVTSPFEPGSVNKLVVASGAIEYGLTTPNEVHQVPGSIRMAGITVNDAWEHGVTPYTTTGIFGKSSNVGTLMLAKKVGEKRFADLLTAYGLGRRTDVGLPAESAGEVPALSQWSGGSFANLPIGQGLSMTLLQMTSMYQAIANDGVRVPPRILIPQGGERGAGFSTAEPVRVVSPETARTVRNMFRAVMQDDPMGVQSGTGAKGAIAGYQTSGKTGTAQQVDPNCNCYSKSSYNITFAGIAPADDPRYVIGIMLDNPVRSSDGSGGQSAAPLFGTIGAWLLQHDKVPHSATPTPKLRLEA